MAELHKMASNGDSTLPSIICGDFNSLPNSPMLDFLLTSYLDYSKLGAWDIGGYSSSQARYREIPTPLLPKITGISQNCLYTHKHDDSFSVVEKTQHRTQLDQSNNDEGTDRCTRVIDAVKNDSEGIIGKCSSKTVQLRQTKEDRMLKAPNNIKYSHSIITHPFRFQSGYPIPRDRGHAPTVTTYHRSACEIVDYVLYTPPTLETGTRGFHLLSRTALPSQHTLRQYGPQPNQAFSSDHLYLQVDLQLIK